MASAVTSAARPRPLGEAARLGAVSTLLHVAPPPAVVLRGVEEHPDAVVRRAQPHATPLRNRAPRLADIPLPGDGFADDLEAIQQSQPKAPAPSWPS